MIYFRSIDPARNRFRWYSLDLQPDLFGGVNLAHRWGRIGNHGGAQRLEHFDDPSAAEAALQAAVARRRKRQYVLVPAFFPHGSHRSDGHPPTVQRVQSDMNHQAYTDEARFGRHDGQGE